MQNYARAIWGTLLMTAGGVAATIGTVYGYITIAGNDYRPVLQLWAIFAGGAVLLLAAAIWVGNKWIRWPSVVLLAMTVLAGIEPAGRLLYYYAG